MESIFSDHKERKIKTQEKIEFTTKIRGIFLFQISARTRSGKQLDGTDDEDLRIEIDGRKFFKPAAFSGGTSKGLVKTIYFFLWLETGLHNLSLVPDISATLINIDVFQINRDPTLAEFSLSLNSTAENGDRRDWITFVFGDAILSSFTTELVLKRRFIDSDDVKIIVDGFVKQNHQNRHQKLWYFIVSLFKGERQSEKFDVDLSTGMHYLELWADRMPKLEKIGFANLVFKVPITIQEKIAYRAKQYSFDPKMMLRLVKRESQFDPKATSSAGAQGLFQLTEITIDEIRKHGLDITDPFDIEQNIEGGFIYFNWLYQRYDGQKDQIKKTLAAWNYGLSHIPIKGALYFEGLPNETKNFIKGILGDYDF